MNKLSTADCTSTNIMFLKSGTFDFLQGAYTQLAEFITVSLIGKSYDPNKVYILSGLDMTTSGGTDTYTTGYVFYAGELFLVPGTSFATGAAVLNLVETSYTINADPTDFSDGTPRDVHIQRTANIVAGASGTGTLTNSTASDYGNLIRINDAFTAKVIDIDGETIYFTNNQTRIYLSPTTGSAGFTLDFTNAREGVEVTLIVGISSSPTITISDGGATSYDANAGYGSLSGCTTIVYTIKYLGLVGSTPNYLIGSYAS